MLKPICPFNIGSRLKESRSFSALGDTEQRFCLSAIEDRTQENIFNQTEDPCYALIMDFAVFEDYLKPKALTGSHRDRL